jgi:hypothetical protein
VQGPTTDSIFIHKEYCFPLFLAYENTTLLNRAGEPMWSGHLANDRDLTKYMENTKKGSAKSLTISGFVRNMPKAHGNQRIKLKHYHQQTFLTFDKRAIFPNSRYIMNSGEMIHRHGKFFIKIGVQKRNSFASIIFVFALLTSFP